MNAAELAAAELAAGMTALAERITASNVAGTKRSVVAAISANLRWGYEKEGRFWVAFERANNGVGSRPHYFGSLKAAREGTFDLDYPMHGPAPKPRRMSFSLA